MKRFALYLLIIFVSLNILMEAYPELIPRQAFRKQTENNEKSYQLPALIIMYDDGNIEDYTRAFPVHKKYGVPGVVGINPAYLGKNNNLDRGHLYLMEQEGWEIASHGHKHAGIIYNSLTRTTNSGDDRLYVKNPSLVETTYDYLLFNSSYSIEEKIEFEGMGVDSTQDHYLKLKNPITHDYPDSRTYIRLTGDSLRQEIVNSKTILEDLGIEVTTFIYPYNGYIKPAKKIVEDNYRQARGGHKKGQSFPEAFINTRPFDRYSLKGVSFENHLLPKDKLNILLRETIEQKGLLIMYAHTDREQFKVSRLEYIIEFAREHNLDIITFKNLEQQANTSD